MDVSGVVELAGAVGGGGLAVGLVDRWRYRGRPRLDVAALAQQVAETSLAHARVEIDRAWKVADTYREQADRYREQVARYDQEVEALRAEVADLRARVERRDQAAADLRAELAATSAELAERTAERDQLRDALARIAGTVPAHGRADEGGTHDVV